jgi:hypothetical protein
VWPLIAGKPKTPVGTVLHVTHQPAPRLSMTGEHHASLADVSPRSGINDTFTILYRYKMKLHLTRDSESALKLRKYMKNKGNYLQGNLEDASEPLASA